MLNLKNLRVDSMLLYFKYKDGLISLVEYQEQIRPLDKEIDKLELQTLSHYLQGNLVSDISSSKHLH